MSMYYMDARYPERPEYSIKSPGTKMTKHFEVPYRSWELYSGPLEGWPVPLNTEPSLQQLFLNFIVILIVASVKSDQSLGHSLV